MLKTGPDVTGLSRAEAREARVSYWREKVAKALASGQTQSDYCRGEGISLGAYFWWKKILTRMKKGAESSPARAADARSKRAAFLPVTVRGAGTGSDYPLEIALGPNRIVRVREDCDPRLLETVVRVIGGLPC